MCIVLSSNESFYVDTAICVSSMKHLMYDYLLFADFLPELLYVDLKSIHVH